ncbi:Head-to-tail connector protein, podovirus-type [uncultured Caudovirales phage]|uniref:Head-to-tail connector protein, podovirus-type n=1 Tax=uncultured Caudovirales phage TaxID=2100421 RepID=A0A6J5LZV2_9CAUD|nr:Head-to-tail connector protein, podovirus-type [uncultured Caudovirales phage]
MTKLSKAHTAAGRYEALVSEREPFLRRARECAELTVPTLMPPAGHNGSTEYYTPWQGTGAEGLNNLSSKLLLALFPPNSPFFRMSIDDFALEELTQQKGARAEIEKALNRYERAVAGEVESRAIRNSAFEALKQLVLSGNTLLYIGEEPGAMRVFRLDRYVVLRDPSGNPLEMVVREDVALAALPDEVQEMLKDAANGKPSDPLKTLQLYTWIKRVKNKWTVHQEINGLVVPESEGAYPMDRCPWLPLRFSRIDGESYGRGYVETMMGDLRALEGLAQAIVEGSAAAARLLILVNPNGTTRAEDVTDSENGAAIAGQEGDVAMLQTNKASDFRVALETINNIERRLSRAFLMNASVQRPGERVTAEEIRFMAGELEDTLGGVYSVLSQELQLPLVKLLIAAMEKGRRLPALPKAMVKPVITTGLEALGRGHDLNKLQLFAQALSALGPDTLRAELNVSDFVTRIGAALGIDTNGLVKSPEQKAQEAQQAQQQQMMMEAMAKLGPGAMNIARDQMAPQAAAAPPQ